MKKIHQLWDRGWEGRDRERGRVGLRTESAKLSGFWLAGSLGLIYDLLPSFCFSQKFPCFLGRKIRYGGNLCTDRQTDRQKH